MRELVEKSRDRTRDETMKVKGVFAHLASLMVVVLAILCGEGRREQH